MVRTSGIIFGGMSKKIKGYLQIGNYFHLNLNSKMIQKYFQLKQKL